MPLGEESGMLSWVMFGDSGDVENQLIQLTWPIQTILDFLLVQV